MKGYLLVVTLWGGGDRDVSKLQPIPGFVSTGYTEGIIVTSSIRS